MTAENGEVLIKYDSRQRDFLNVLCAVHWECCVFVIFANCKDKLTALCEHAPEKAIIMLLPNAKQMIE